MNSIPPFFDIIVEQRFACDLFSVKIVDSLERDYKFVFFFSETANMRINWKH